MKDDKIEGLKVVIETRKTDLCKILAIVISMVLSTFTPIISRPSLLIVRIFLYLSLVAVVNENVSLVISRQLLSEICSHLNTLETAQAKEICHFILDKIQPRVISFEEQVTFHCLLVVFSKFPCHCHCELHNGMLSANISSVKLRCYYNKVNTVLLLLLKLLQCVYRYVASY